MEEGNVQNPEQSPAKKPKIDGPQSGEVGCADNTAMDTDFQTQELTLTKRGLKIDFQDDENVIFDFTMTPEMLSKVRKGKEEKAKAEAAARERVKKSPFGKFLPAEINPYLICPICLKKGAGHEFLACPLREGNIKTYCFECCGTCKDVVAHAEMLEELLMLCTVCRKVGDHWTMACPRLTS